MVARAQLLYCINIFFTRGSYICDVPISINILSDGDARECDQRPNRVLSHSGTAGVGAGAVAHAVLHSSTGDRCGGCFRVASGYEEGGCAVSEEREKRKKKSELHLCVFGWGRVHWAVEEMEE